MRLRVWNKKQKLSALLNMNKYKNIVYFLILFAKTLKALYSIAHLFTFPPFPPFSHSLFLPPPLLSSNPLVYHVIMAVVRDGGAHSSYRNSHRSACLQSTPKPADSRQKIKGDKKKSTLSSFHPSPPLRYHNHQQYRSFLQS